MTAPKVTELPAVVRIARPTPMAEGGAVVRIASTKPASRGPGGTTAPETTTRDGRLALIVSAHLGKTPTVTYTDETGPARLPHLPEAEAEGAIGRGRGRGGRVAMLTADGMKETVLTRSTERAPDVQHNPTNAARPPTAAAPLDRSKVGAHWGGVPAAGAGLAAAAVTPRPNRPATEKTPQQPIHHGQPLAPSSISALSRLIQRRRWRRRRCSSLAPTPCRWTT